MDIAGSDTIPRAVPEKLEPLPSQETLDRAREMLNYRPFVLSGRLQNLLAELELEVLDNRSVHRYMEEKIIALNKMFSQPGSCSGPYWYWRHTKIAEYLEPVPIHVLNKAMQIKRLRPEAEFFIVHLGREPDQFLYVSLRTSEHSNYIEGFYLEVWDEPTFEGRAPAKDAAAAPEV